MVQHQHSHKPGQPTPAGDGQQFSLQTIITALRCWWFVTVPLGLLLGIVAGVTTFFLVPLTYTASAWIIVREKPSQLLTPFSAEDPQKFVQNQLELLRSPMVIQPVSALPEVKRTPELMGPDPEKALQRLAKFRQVGKSEFFVVEFSSIKGEQAVLVANELANKFLELQTAQESTRTSETIRLLKEKMKQQKDSVEVLRKNVQVLAIEKTGKNPFDTRPKEDTNQNRNPMFEIQSQLIAAEIDVALLEAQVNVETELLKTQPDQVSQTDLNRFVEEHPRVAAGRASLEIDRAKLQDYERASKDLDRNGTYQQLKKKVVDADTTFQKVVEEIRASSTEEILRQVHMAREDELSKLQRRYENAQLTKKILKEKFETALKDQKQYTEDTLDLEFKRADYERASAVHQAIADRILTIETEQRAPLRVEKWKTPIDPTTPDESVRYKKVMMASAGAFVLPFVLAVCIEHLYRRVSHRDQLEAAGGISVVGEITVLPRARSGPANRELQLFQETVDGLRTALSLGESLKKFQVLAVTSAVSREGKTSLGVQLAVSVARAMGERTLLIDGDMRSPDLHRAFDLDRSPGLADLLHGKCSLSEAIKSSASGTIEVMPAGNLTTSPHRVMGSEKFERLIQELRGTYAHIIIDTPPVLAASEALVMARVADVALLCVRRDFSRVRQVSEAFSRLQKAGVKTAGAVLGGIPAREYIYRYGSYYIENETVIDEAESEEMEA